MAVFIDGFYYWGIEDLKRDLVTNFPERYLQKYQQAVDRYNVFRGDIVLFIRKDAYDVGKNLLPGYHAVCTHHLHGGYIKDFWEILEKEFIPTV